MKIRILTLFPEMFDKTLGSSILQRAIDNGYLDIQSLNIRDFSDSKHKKVDDYPYGGGPGMVMTPQPVFDCHKQALENLDSIEAPRTIYMSPKGKVFNQKLAQELSKEKALIFICGHYEGIDQRIIDTLVTDEISIGDYVLTGGEIPAMAVVDAVARLIPGVLSQEESYKDESFYNGLLEYPQYTRPQDFRGMTVPDVLTSGNHKDIDEWRFRQSVELTRNRRPDLLKDFVVPKDKEKLFKKITIEEKDRK
ncbi:tRNA (guanosine(37)-N1)-methyltransferase TrmD [Alkaliphilus serpentinus]|uniref:tRNA (guanine-N(1)-)-methyltransferase n=1 Tax=Alkaliphilus serpentinus TaxID=1482731 RepID=A0A833HQ19_9FIRM|nr:tRNA (guanosine(37)-N1)-methyltransferase TrmD [Alkaliphilus serpentinus]KAB3531407.1 tRNA (guanosine(37)-N1)-methyltransferase TrmD [Alkaliphilus serpentinus]